MLPCKKHAEQRACCHKQKCAVESSSVSHDDIEGQSPHQLPHRSADFHVSVSTGVMRTSQAAGFPRILSRCHFPALNVGVPRSSDTHWCRIFEQKYHKRARC